MVGSWDLLQGNGPRNAAKLVLVWIKQTKEQLKLKSVLNQETSQFKSTWPIMHIVRARSQLEKGLVVRGGQRLIYAAAIMRCMFGGVHVRFSNSNAVPNVKHAAVSIMPGACFAVTRLVVPTGHWSQTCIKNHNPKRKLIPLNECRPMSLFHCHAVTSSAKTAFFSLWICICKDYQPYKSFHVNIWLLQILKTLSSNHTSFPTKRFLSKSSSLVFVYRAKALINGYCNVLHFDTELVPYSCSFSDLCLISSEQHFPILIKYNKTSCSRLRRSETWFFYPTCQKQLAFECYRFTLFFWSNFHFSW